ncbi:hypothetical protein BN1723_000086, partial [Verticillium longisporum]
NDSELELLVGGTHDKSKGFFVQPTVYATTNKAHKLMSTELFGPVLVVHVYDDSVNATQAFSETCDLVDSTGEYGLTGSVFASDREAIRFAEEKLRNSAGNFYINCKSTGAVVGQQPLDIVIRVEIDQHDKEGKTDGYGLSVPLLHYTRPVTPAAPFPQQEHSVETSSRSRPRSH